MLNRLTTAMAGLVLAVAAFAPLGAAAQTVDEIIIARQADRRDRHHHPALRLPRRQPEADRLRHRGRATRWARRSAFRSSSSPSPRPGRIPSLLTNQVDAVVSIFSITAERAHPDRLFASPMPASRPW